MPFPAPIPTIDNLPLRRGIINFDWKEADQYSMDADCFLTAGTDKPTTTPGRSDAIWGFSRLALAVAKLTKNMLCGLTPWRHKGLLIKQNPTVRTAITVPFFSRCETCSVEPEQVSALGLVDGAYVLQIKLSFPLLLIHHTTTLANIIRVGASSRIAQTAASIVRAFFEIIIRWLLSVFQIEVAIELRRI
jgi:F-type H+-transporting ATPase subunit delta